MSGPLTTTTTTTINAQQHLFGKHIECEFVAVILAATVGARLFPLTSATAGATPTAVSTAQPSPTDNKDGAESAAAADSAAATVYSQQPTVPYKHLLPLGGGGDCSVLRRLLHTVYQSNFMECVLVVAPDDIVTIPHLQSAAVPTAAAAGGDFCFTPFLEPTTTERSDVTSTTLTPTHPVYLYGPAAVASGGSGSLTKQQQQQKKMSRRPPMKVTVVRLNPDPASGSVAALRFVETSFLQHQPHLAKSHLVVLPGDLCIVPSSSIVGDDNHPPAAAPSSRPLQSLVDAHRRGQEENGTEHSYHQQQQLSSSMNNNNAYYQNYNANSGGAAATASGSRSNNTNDVWSSFDNKTACTMLLTNVLEVDEHGVPLKESAKAKKGGLAREEEEIEYMALVYNHPESLQSSSGKNVPNNPRIVWKQSKLDVEEDRDMLGSSPKWLLNKARLQASQSSVTRVGLHWNDVHVYAISPWVRKLIVHRPKMVSIQNDLIPLLVARQFKGVQETFGRIAATTENDDNDDTLSPKRKEIAEDLKFLLKSKYNYDSINNSEEGGGSVADGTSGDDASVGGGGGPETGGKGAGSGNSTDPGLDRPSSPISTIPAPSSSFQQQQSYHVGAVVLPAEGTSALRAFSIPAYLHANKELANSVCQQQNNSSASAADDILLPKDTTVNRKFSTIVLPGTQLGSKITFKSAVVGRHCKLGNKCRLNNVVLMDHVTVGDNVILQNSIIAAGCTIGENSNLNDCQVCKDIPAGTKEKSESFMAE